MESNKTTLFNLHELRINDTDLLIEFYAGDIFDIYSNILLLSAFKDGFYPSKGTTWGSLYERTGISFETMLPEDRVQKSENIHFLRTKKNKCFDKLIAFELTDLRRKNGFTRATLLTRYKELADFLENYPSEEDESISLPLLGTGNQGLSLEDSISTLLKTINNLSKTKLKIIRVFARNFESIGALNIKINEQLNRNEVVHNNLLDAAIEEAKDISSKEISLLSKNTILNLLSLSAANHSSLNTFGINGRFFAESICDEFIRIFEIAARTTTLETKIKEITLSKKLERQYVISYLRLLQSYGNQVAHPGNPNLNHQDAAAIIIAIVRIVDFYELKNNTAN
ncbi:MAG: hypothetical protein ACOH2V_10535 [Candidatus Saccharimonadaceae bacterium]